MLIKGLFLFGLAVVIAAIEIESEGKHGWADKAPTWYRTTGIAAIIYGILMSKKPLTGYHLFMFLLPVFIFHIQFVMGMRWSLTNEAMAFAAYFLFCPVWDFLWFVLNPYYGIKNFKKEKIWWHAKSVWIGPLPLDYYVGLIVSIIFGATASFLSRDPYILQQHLMVVGIMILLVGVTILAAPLYHKWYWYMRQKDDRNKVDIFYK